MSNPYREQYLKNKWNFSIELEHDGSDVVNFVLGCDCKRLIIRIKGVYFKKTVDAGSEVIMRCDIEELVVEPTGGVNTDDYLKANQDRSETDEIGLITLIDDVGDPLVIDRTGAINIFRSGGLASRRVVSYSTNLDFEYKTLLGGYYLVRSQILDAGANDESSVVIYGVIEEY